MLRFLSGTQHGWFGSLALDPAFIDALATAAEPPRIIGATASA
jgi:hypothetical protein